MSRSEKRGIARKVAFLIMRTSRVSVYDRNESETILQELLEELGHKSEGAGSVYWQEKHFNVYSHTTFFIEEKERGVRQRS